MDALTYVYPYYNCPQMLALHCGMWLSYPLDLRKRVKVVIVDDGSPDRPALPVLRKMGLGMDIQLFRVVEDLGWNCGGAKNLGMTHVATDWVVLGDIDHAIPHETASRILDGPAPDSKYAYQFERFWADGRLEKPHADTLLMRTRTFWDAGGYDEDYSFKLGGAHFHVAIDNLTGGRRVLEGAWLYAVQNLLPQDVTPVSNEQKMDGRRRRQEVTTAKRQGKLLAKPLSWCRFKWERLL